MAFTFETFVTVLVTVAIIVTNVLVLLVLHRTDQLTHVNKYYFTSLTVADLCVGVFVAPFSPLASLFDRWIYGATFCQIDAYTAAIFWIASVYSLTWVSIDHYVAIRKPDRYDSIMTRTRCVCWVVFIWIASVCFCCPPLFGVARARYYTEAFVCIIDWNLQKAYFITSGLLIIVPPIIALSVANSYIFSPRYRQDRVVLEKCQETSSRPDMYLINCLVCGLYLLTWVPWCSLQLYEILHMSPATAAPDGSYPTLAPTKLHFYLMWLAMSNSFLKFCVYVCLCHDFRIGIRILYSRTCCARWNSTE